VVVVAQAEAMPEQAMADSVVAAVVANKHRLAQAPLLAMVELAAAVVEVLVRTNKARAAPLPWLSSGEELR
jgi:hypothetical protein